MNDVNVRNLTIFSERRRNLRPALLLWNLFINIADDVGLIKAKKTDLAASLNVSERTVANWIHALVSVGSIKYKYSGKTLLNPNIYFSGSKKNYKKALQEWKTFKSDI